MPQLNAFGVMISKFGLFKFSWFGVNFPGCPHEEKKSNPGICRGVNSALVKPFLYVSTGSGLAACRGWYDDMIKFLIWLNVTHFFFTGSIFQPASPPRWSACPVGTSIFTQTGQAQENPPKGPLLGWLPREKEHKRNFQEAEQLVSYGKRQLWVPRGHSNIRALKRYALGCLSTMADQLS